MDSYAIASAIATRFSSANVSAPSGAENIKQSTAQLPESLTFFPSVLVSPPRVDSATWRLGRGYFSITYRATLFLAKHDGSPRRAKALHDWVTALYKQLAGNLDLDLAYVALAQLARADAGVVEYEGIEYDGIVMDIDVQANEAVTFTA